MHLLLHLLLKLYPRAYRERYGDEIAAVVREQQECDGGGPLFWCGVAWDHVAAARRVRRRMRTRGWGETMIEDIRGAVRSLMRSRRFAFFAALTLGLGIGATASVLTVADRVLLRPLPWDGAERMVELGTYIMGGEDLAVLSGPLLLDFIERLDVAEAVVGASRGRPVRTDLAEPFQLTATQVSPGYFPFFEGEAVAGRLLDDADHRAGAPPVVVLSHGYWTEAFGADPAAIGRSLELDGTAHTIVGVLDPAFTAPRPTFWAEDDLVRPLGLYQRELSEGSFSIQAVARLRPDVGPEQLQAELEGIGRERYVDRGGFVTGFGSAPFRDTVLGPSVGTNLGRVLGAVALLLLVGCVNVASLLLTRASQRRDEFRTRASLGATRGRLLSQLLWESAALAILGSGVGAAMAWGGVEFFRSHAPAGVPRIAEITFDPRMLIATVVLSVSTVLVFGAAPAWAASRGAGGPTTRSTHGRGQTRARSALVGLETALAAALVIWSGLLARDLVEMSNEDPGFRGDGLVAGQLDLRGRTGGASAESRRDFVRRLSESAGAIPGVQRVAIATELPYSGNALVSSMTPLDAPEVAEGTFIPVVAVDGDYFEAFGLDFVQGRPFDTERDDDRMLAVVNEAFVRQYWPDLDPLAGAIKSGGEDVDDEGVYEVVGVVADVRTVPGRPAPPKMYADYANEAFVRFHIVLQTDGPVAPVVQSLRSAVSELDAGLPLNDVTTLDAVETRALAEPTFYASIFASFGLVALLLALVGIYGTTAYATASRGREIGIRVALGEHRARIVSAIVRRTLVVVGVGALAGGSIAMLGSVYAADALRLVDPRDPLTYGAVSLLVVATATVAAWIPARRLSAVDPNTALRGDDR